MCYSLTLLLMAMFRWRVRFMMWYSLTLLWKAMFRWKSWVSDVLFVNAAVEGDV
jgi:hypothetical protein